MWDAHFALFFNHGQCCAAGSRLFVHEKIYDTFVAKAAEAARNRRVAAVGCGLWGAVAPRGTVALRAVPLQPVVAAWQRSAG